MKEKTDRDKKDKGNSSRKEESCSYSTKEKSRDGCLINEIKQTKNRKVIN